MIIKKSEILITAARPDQYPEAGPVEIALAGRSNVGKSSLINTLINRKNLARTSGQPGKTQTLNFYNINDLFRFVDLPGYGYARVSKADRVRWGKMINTYLESRDTMKEMFLLVDIRHKPNEHDAMMYHWMVDNGFAGYVIATKADKISGNDRFKAVKRICEALGIEDKKLVIPFSATKKMNIDKIWRTIEGILIEEDVDLEGYIREENTSK
ncbi:MAG: ribosome biogenesis GTP-binding protein YihA/YsxC [Tissierellales bacterium]|jgi:GTP-binding protein|nr:ribosome biogenesis GTP-binding protein YihA/YsxC [Tissierellales bacterium]